MDESTATGVILKANEPWREINSKLYYEFLESIQAYSSNPQIFDTVADYAQNCTDTLELMRGMKAKVENAELSEEEVCLENERNTWRLIYCLYQNRLHCPDFSSAMDVQESTCISERDVIDLLYKNDRMIREYQLIIDWLEKNALDQSNRQPMIEHYTDRTIAWENTLHQLHNLKSGISFKSTRPIITTLDPDAPVREGRPLHDLDKEDDARLEKRMFIEIRCGRLQKAQALAIHCGQPWRAACLLGWTPHHDPNYENPVSDTKLPNEGNFNRDLWKLCAWKLSQDSRIGSYYRAIYASLCGNVQQLLPVLLSWQDALWAYMKTLLDIKVESEVRGMMPKNYIDMPPEYWKGEMSLDDIFDELEGSKNPFINSQAATPDHRIQKYLLLDQIPTLMDDIDRMIDLGTCETQFLRFLAHLVLFLKQIGKITQDRIANKVLQAYVHVLIEIGDPILVAYYTATLPEEIQVKTYAYFLKNIKEHDQRKKCLTAAEEANLNIEAIAKMVVENIRMQRVDMENHELQAEQPDADTEKIDALDWLLFYPNQREEALWQTNALVRFFLKNEKIDAARKAINKLPRDSIKVIMNEYPSLENTVANITATNNIPKKPSLSIREYLGYEAYLAAHEGFTEWFSNFHHSKPSPLQELPQYASFSEKVAYDHKKAQFNVEMDRWKCIMQHQTATVKQLLYNVLLFPDGGWLVDSVSDDQSQLSGEVIRKHQLKSLRMICIPKITFLLHTVMSEMNEHAECIQLADLLASEQHKLYKVFPKERLREIFRKICESSVVLMNRKKDPWGYSK